MVCNTVAMQKINPLASAYWLRSGSGGLRICWKAERYNTWNMFSGKRQKAGLLTLLFVCFM
jgi:hypothetical protein